MPCASEDLVTQLPTTDPAARRPPAALVAYRALIGVFSLLVLVQAGLAGQFLNGQGELRETHQLIAVAVFPVLCVALVIFAVIGRKTGGTALLVISVGLLLLTVAQTGLGFVGRSRLGAASIHIPLGVALFGLAIFGLGLVKRLGRP